MDVYLGDFLVVGKTQEAFKTLCDLLEELGFTISPSKVVEPCQKLTFLGVEIDIHALTLSLPQQKLHSLKEVLISFCTWRSRQGLLKSNYNSLQAALTGPEKLCMVGEPFFAAS